MASKRRFFIYQSNKNKVSLDESKLPSLKDKLREDIEAKEIAEALAEELPKRVVKKLSRKSKKNE
jgi:hypothetical protein